MCRFAAYLGPPISVDTLTTLPSHSIVKQSYRALERDEPLNGDGFGIAWYVPERSLEPARYRAVTPAWSDENLIELARVTSSHCIFAHVRAATPGISVTQTNCHPFTAGRFAFMHNGYIARYGELRRRLMMSLPDPLWASIRGTTDSELLFAIFRDEHARAESTGHVRILDALGATIRRTLAISKEAGVGEPHQLNLAVTDGESLVVTRYTDGEPETANSLHVHAGKRYVVVDDVTSMVDADDGGSAVLIASESLSDDPGWARVPANHAVVVDARRRSELVPLALGARTG